MRSILRISILGTTSILMYPIIFTNTEFHYQKTAFNETVLQECAKHLKGYRPAMHLPMGALQSLWNVYGVGKQDKKMIIEYERDIIKLEDGGQIGIDWAYPDPQDPNLTKVCFVFPGLSGGSDKAYIKGLVKPLVDKGYIVGIIMNRGIIEYTSPLFPDLSSNEEMAKALQHTIKKFKNSPNVHFVGIGMSMGANLMMRYAGETKDDFPLEAIIAFNCPFDLWLAINLMRGSQYEKYLARELRKNVFCRENPSLSENKIFDEMQKKFDISFEEIKRCETWKDFDEKFTLKVHPEIKSIADYYYKASCLAKVQDIKVPTLVIHSRDDPIIPIECLPIDECLVNENIIVGIVRRGGHVCYFQGLTGKARWYPLVAAEYLDSVIKVRERLKHTLHEELIQEIINDTRIAI